MHAQLQVVSTQPGPSVTMADTKPENYLALSLFTCLCCCWVFGIIALVMSLQVRWCMIMHKPYILINYTFGTSVYGISTKFTQYLPNTTNPHN